MRDLHINRLFLLASILLLSNISFASSFKTSNENISKNYSLTILTVDGITPSSGHAGSVVKITGTGFTSNSVIQLGSAHAVAYYGKGFDSTTMLEKIRKPYPDIPLYVCGENYSEKNNQCMECKYTIYFINRD